MKKEQEKQVLDEKTLRHFGFLVGGIFLFIGFWPLFSKILAFAFHGSLCRFLCAVLGGYLLFFGFTKPNDLETAYRYWMILGVYLGGISTRIILGALFFALVTPLGFVMRLLGYDPLRLKFESFEPSYRLPVKPRDENHFEKQF